MDIPGLGGCRCVEKGTRFWGPLLPKNIGLEFWVGFDIWLRHVKHVIKRAWEEGVPAFLGMNRWDPGLDWPGDEAKVELWGFGPLAKKCISGASL